jgi:hypothetical protein
VGPQLRRRLSILGNVIHTVEVFRLASIALRSDPITLGYLLFNVAIPKPRQRTLDLRFLQLSHAIDVILPRGVRNA